MNKVYRVMLVGIAGLVLSGCGSGGHNTLNSSKVFTNSNWPTLYHHANEYKGAQVSLSVSLNGSGAAPATINGDKGQIVTLPVFTQQGGEGSYSVQLESDRTFHSGFLSIQGTVLGQSANDVPLIKTTSIKYVPMRVAFGPIIKTISSLNTASLDGVTISLQKVVVAQRATLFYVSARNNTSSAVPWSAGLIKSPITDPTKSGTITQLWLYPYSYDINQRFRPGTSSLIAAVYSDVPQIESRYLYFNLGSNPFYCMSIPITPGKSATLVNPPVTGQTSISSNVTVESKPGIKIEGTPSANTATDFAPTNIPSSYHLVEVKLVSKQFAQDTEDSTYNGGKFQTEWGASPAVVNSDGTVAYTFSNSWANQSAVLQMTFENSAGQRIHASVSFHIN